MSKEIQSSWMLAPKSFVSLLGAEYHLMRDAGVLKRFYISALLIVIIIILTAISFYYALDLLFHSISVQILLAIFFCLLFLCIYIFLLNTFAKENQSKKTIFNLSNIIRTGFVAFMGFLLAQPVIILQYKDALIPIVENYKQELLIKHISKIDELTNKEVTKLLKKQHYYTDQKALFNTSAYDKELVSIANQLNIIENKTAALHRSAQQTIGRNSFFLFRVQTVHRKHPISWLFTLLVVLLFLLPGYLVYTISSQHIYYILKKAGERELITEAHGAFTDRYKTLFNEDLAIFSRYEDPPFNTVRKHAPVPAPMTAFLQKYLDNG
jgi:hypothetical protein